MIGYHSVSAPQMMTLNFDGLMSRRMLLSKLMD